MDEKRIRGGPWWRIWEGVQRGEWTVDQVIEKIDLLKGPNAKVLHRVSDIILGTDHQRLLDNSIG
jgi:hypothetical protein